MEAGAEYDEALAEAQRLGYAEADPTEDVNGADAAAKMAILATVAFGSRVRLDDVVRRRHRAHHERPRARGARARDGGAARRLGDARGRTPSTSASSPSFVDRHHPLAAVEGPFNAVMLQGDAIREITLEGPGAGGLATASAVVADMVSVIGTTGTGFLQNDACWRTLERCRPATCARRSTSASRSTTGPACSHTSPLRLAEHDVSIARLDAATARRLRVARHRHARGGQPATSRAAAAAIARLPEVRGEPDVIRVVTERGV